MAETTKIEWTDATVNFWWGCTKVGPGCDRCYAETWSGRFGESLWGVGAPRRKIKGAVALIQRLNGSSFFYENDRRMRVFIQSMSDLFDTEVPLAWFAEAWGKIAQCDRLDIQIVTKRISVVEKRLDAIGVTTWPKHAGLLVTVCNQGEADRDIPRLLALKAKLGIPWVGVSAEPLLGPIDFTSVAYQDGQVDALRGDLWGGSGTGAFASGLDWIIVGGESGPNARPMHPDWARAIRDQCADAGTAFFFKQWGEWKNGSDFAGDAKAVLSDGTVSDPTPEALGQLDRIESVPRRQPTMMRKVGKARAGRLLDGVTHDGFPSCSGLPRASTPSSVEASA